MSLVFPSARCQCAKNEIDDSTANESSRFRDIRDCIINEGHTTHLARRTVAVNNKSTGDTALHVET